FVEAVMGIRADSQYLNELPHIDLIDSKGLDFQRQKYLTNSIRDRAWELSSCLMLVVICEEIAALANFAKTEAVEKFSVMNRPDGDCPLCLYPLVPEDEQKNALPFMKLMYCFHCFSKYIYIYIYIYILVECIIRWWSWLQKEEKRNTSDSSSAHLHRDVRNHKTLEESMGNCAVCRKAYHTQDLEHVLHLVDNHSSQLNVNVPRQNFEARLKLQQENCGLIEPKKDLVVLPGMVLPPPPVSPLVSGADKESTEQQQISIWYQSSDPN
ncbi:hypothetical protein D8674_037928, partial [Pyrus ussuriensis x Pyrus communis]